MNKKTSKLLDKLEAQRSELLQLFEHMSEEEFTALPEDGGWSVSQVINHIIISEYGTTRYIQKKLKGLSDLPETGIKNQINSKGLKLALKSSKKFRAPEALPDPENKSKEATLKTWEEVRQNLQETFSNMPQDAMDKEIFKHPVVGYFNPEQTLHFLNDHIHHHGPQIHRILKSIKP